MNFPRPRFLAILLFASTAFGQTGRVLHFTHTGSARNFKEIAGMIHVVADVEASPDEAARTLAVHGTAGQVAAAEWLFGELDKPEVPAPDNQDAAVRNYQLEGGGDNTVRLFFLLHQATVQDFQQVAVAARAVADMTRVGTYNQSRAIAARGTPDQIALAAWIVDALDRPAGEQAPSRDYRMPANSDRFGQVAARILYASHAATVQDFQEIATAMRNTADIRRVFTYNSSRAIILRAAPEEIELADWLLQQLDKPVAGPAADSSGTFEYDTRYDRDNMVEVFYVPQTATIQDFQQFATRIRTAVNLRRVFTYNAPRAIAVRGTVDQVAEAQRMVNELARPK